MGRTITMQPKEIKQNNGIFQNTSPQIRCSILKSCPTLQSQNFRFLINEERFLNFNE